MACESSQSTGRKQEVDVREDGSSVQGRECSPSARLDGTSSQITRLTWPIVVGPILEPFLPWNKPAGAAYSVFVLPWPAELDREGPAAEKAITDFFKTLEKLF